MTHLYSFLPSPPPPHQVCGGSHCPSIYHLGSRSRTSTLTLPKGVATQSAIFASDRVRVGCLLPTHACTKMHTLSWTCHANMHARIYTLMLAVSTSHQHTHLRTHTHTLMHTHTHTHITRLTICTHACLLSPLSTSGRWKVTYTFKACIVSTRSHTEPYTNTCTPCSIHTEIRSLLKVKQGSSSPSPPPSLLPSPLPPSLSPPPPCSLPLSLPTADHGRVGTTSETLDHQRCRQGQHPFRPRPRLLCGLQQRSSSELPGVKEWVSARIGWCIYIRYQCMQPRHSFNMLLVQHLHFFNSPC